MEDQERIEENGEDVEAHLATEDAEDDGGDDDDFQAHMLREPPTRQ